MRIDEGKSTKKRIAQIKMCGWIEKFEKGNSKMDENFKKFLPSGLPFLIKASKISSLRLRQVNSWASLHGPQRYKSEDRL